MEASLWSTPVVVSSLKDTLWAPQVRRASDSDHLSYTVGQSTQYIIQSGMEWKFQIRSKSICSSCLFSAFFWSGIRMGLATLYRRHKQLCLLLWFYYGHADLYPSNFANNFHSGHQVACVSYWWPPRLKQGKSDAKLCMWEGSRLWLCEASPVISPHIILLRDETMQRPSSSSWQIEYAS